MNKDLHCHLLPLSINFQFKLVGLVGSPAYVGTQRSFTVQGCINTTLEITNDSMIIWRSKWMYHLNELSENENWSLGYEYLLAIWKQANAQWFEFDQKIGPGHPKRSIFSILKWFKMHPFISFKTFNMKNHIIMNRFLNSNFSWWKQATWNIPCIKFFFFIRSD